MNKLQSINPTGNDKLVEHSGT